MAPDLDGAVRADPFRDITFDAAEWHHKIEVLFIDYSDMLFISNIRYGSGVKETRTELPEHRVAFGKRLRQLRTEADMYQSQVASAAGMDRSFYAEVEAGRKNISLDKIAAVAAVFGVRIKTLFDDEPAAKQSERQGDS